MKKTFTLLTVLILLLPVTATGQWIAEATGSGSICQKLYAFDDNTALLTFGSSLVYKTINGGQSWVDVSPIGVASKNLMSIDFGDADTGMIAAGDTFLLRTKDQGDTWSVVSMTKVCADLAGTADDIKTGSGWKLYAVGFNDKYNCFTTISYKNAAAAYRCYVFRSQDAGLTWHKVSDDLAGGKTVTTTAIDFADDGLTGYITGSGSFLLKTEDGGATWTKLTTTGLAFDTKYLTDLVLINKDSLYMPSQVGVFKSTDGMQTFTQLSTAYAQDFIIVSDTIFLAVGTSGNTIRSLNYGSTWETAGNGAGSFFEAAVFNNKVYSLASGGVTYITTPDQLLDPVAAFEASVDKNILTINDQSANLGTKVWTIGDQTVTGDLTTFTLPKLGNFTIALTGTNTVAEVSSDPAEVYVDTISTPWATSKVGDQILQKMAILKTDTIAVIVGNNTSIFYTTNSGKTWNPSVFADSLIGHVANDVKFFNQTTGLASFSYASGKAYTNGFLARTTDGGATWTAIKHSVFDSGEANDTLNPVLGTSPYYYALGVKAPDSAFVMVRYQASNGTKYGYLYVSGDQGLTWSLYRKNFCYPSYSSPFTCMGFDETGKTGYITGVSKYWKTSDYGKSWTEVSRTDFGSINDMEILDADHVFFATQYGAAKTSDGFATYTLNPTDYSFDVIKVADNVFVTGKDENTFKVTTDGGDTWELNTAGMDNFFELTLFNDEVLAFGAGGNIYHAHIDNFLPVVAGFDYSVDDLTVTFTNTSVGGEPAWDLGDGNTSAELDPVHTYADYDTYNVSVTVSNLCKLRTYTAAVPVVDAINPTIDNCPSDITADLYTGTAVEVSWTEPTASDNSGTVELTSTHQPGDQFAPGTTTVTYTATDAAGNTASCSFDVTVVDHTGTDNLELPTVGIFPNPSDGTFVRLLPGNLAMGMMDIEIFSIDGRKVLSTRVDYAGGELPLNLSLASGVYQVRMTDAEGAEGVSKMIVY
ncbi:MAG: HYR domain-containing protein [Bacteroidota bacterium]